MTILFLDDAHLRGVWPGVNLHWRNGPVMYSFCWTRLMLQGHI
jgi:hypothetical protein